jgi:hypothetical protein
VDTIRRKLLAKLSYQDPKSTLRRMAVFRACSEASFARPKVQQWRVRGLQKYGQEFQAAFLCYGLSLAQPEASWRFAMTEDSDYDAAFKILTPGTTQPEYRTVQLKEVVPESTNEAAELGKVLLDLEKYSDSDDLTIGVFLNQTRPRLLKDIYVPPIRLAGLWIYGFDARRGCFLWGNLVDQPAFHRICGFDYPPVLLPGMKSLTEA